MPGSNGLRLAELLASLSLAIDLGTGQPLEWVMKCTLLAANLSKALGLSEDDQRDVFFLSLLRHVGCTANAHADAGRFGDELGAAEGLTLDMDDVAQAFGFVFRSAGRGRPPLERLGYIGGLLAAGPGVAKINHAAHCEVAERISETLGFSPAVAAGLWQIYERWDGKGDPKGLKGEDIALPVRVIHLAQDAATFYSLNGIESATTVVRGRAGRQLDPTFVDSFCRFAPDLCSALDADSLWEALLTAEPGRPVQLTDSQIDAGCLAVADFTDMKSPFTLNHSRHVSQLAEASARLCGLPETDAVNLRRAGLLHDIGRVGVSAGIWGKAGSLTESEWERVRLHPYYTERVLSRSKTLEPLGALAALHHERLDGSGYHRRLPGASLPLSARLLAAADAYCAMTELRPHRTALTPEAAADQLRREARSGELDEKAVEAVLVAAGHASRLPTCKAASVELSEREIEVLRLVARGLSNKEMAARLVISPKTVGHHVQHIYNKIGVSTRAGATLFAIQNNLLEAT
ncbi:MAG: HD domain-containing protein [Chloroflexi bacterium]|nr:HD domain-containing protein [Chloroflexota bacterium]